MSVLNTLGQTVLPDVFSSLKQAGLVETMTVKAESAATTGSGGGRIKGSVTDAYTNVPVAVEQTGERPKGVEAGSKTVPTVRFKLTFPTHQNGSRLNIDAKLHRFIVNARGNEPAKTYRAIATPDDNGVVYEVIAEKEG